MIVARVMLHWKKLNKKCCNICRAMCHKEYVHWLEIRFTWIVYSLGNICHWLIIIYIIELSMSVQSKSWLGTRNNLVTLLLLIILHMSLLLRKIRTCTCMQSKWSVYKDNFFFCFRRWQPNVDKAVPKKQYYHRAAFDIKDSLNELCYYKDHLFVVKK